MLSPTNGRVFLCDDVEPGATYDFNFNITVPGGASGSMRFAVRMVRDGVEWFGASHAFTISVGSSPARASVRYAGSFSAFPARGETRCSSTDRSSRSLTSP